MTELKFKTPNGDIFTTTREQIMDKAQESFFAAMTDPEQQMQVKDKDGCFTLTYESKYYAKIFGHLNQLNSDNYLLPVWDPEWTWDDNEQFIKDLEYFLWPIDEIGDRCRYILNKLGPSIVDNQKHFAEIFAEWFLKILERILIIKASRLVTPGNCGDVLNVENFTVVLTWTTELSTTTPANEHGSHSYKVSIEFQPSGLNSYESSKLDIEIHDDNDDINKLFGILELRATSKSVFDSACVVLESKLGAKCVTVEHRYYRDISVKVQG